MKSVAALTWEVGLIYGEVIGAYSLMLAMTVVPK
jgi:hypothetical protein